MTLGLSAGGILRVSCALALLAAAHGCGDDSTGGSSDGGGADGAVGAFEPTPPDIPWWDDDAGTGMPPIAPPVLTPCVAGWREATTETGVVYCDPWPETGPAVCPEGQAHFVGDPGCTSIGAPCPAGDFPADIPAGAMVRYVRAGATGGNGTEAAPFGTISEAVAGAPAGTIVAIAKGRYDEMVQPPSGVTLLGACAAETILTQTAGVAPGTPGGALYVTASDVVARDLQVADAALIGIWIEAGASLELDGVIVSRATTQGISVTGSLVARDVVVRDTRPRVRDSAGGSGFALDPGSTADLTRVVVERNHAFGMASFGGTLRVRDSFVRDTQPEVSTGFSGIGIVSTQRGNVAIERTVVDGSHTSGIGAQQAGSVLSATDVVVRRTRPQMSDGLGGFAIAALIGSNVTVSRAFVADTIGGGLQGRGDGTTLTVDDAVVVDTAPAPGSDFSGQAVFALANASVTVRRAVLSRPTIVAMESLTGAALVAEDVRIDEVVPVTSDGIGSAYGLTAAWGGTLTWRRGFVEHLLTNAIALYHDGTRISLEDVLVRDTDSNPFGYGLGVGLSVHDGASIDTSRVVVTGTAGVGVIGADLSSVSLVDTIVRDSRPVPDSLLMGRGVVLQNGSTASLERVRIANSREFGIIGFGDSPITGRDVAIVDTHQQECADTTCAETPGGSAIVTTERASVVLDRFLIERADLCGVQIARAASADLVNGEIRGTSIGACVQVPDYDVGRLSNGVAYRDNASNVQATTLPVPDIMDFGGEPPPPPP